MKELAMVEGRKKSVSRALKKYIIKLMTFFECDHLISLLQRF